MVNTKFRILSVVLFASSVLFVFPTEAHAVMMSLDGISTQNQTFTDDSNVTMTPSGSAHVLGWQGFLPISRGGTGVGSFTAGSLMFFNGSTFAENNSNLFWDNTNNRLGIGTSSPTSTLGVNGNTSISGDLEVAGNITSTNLVPYTGATQDLDLGFHNLFLGKEGESSYILTPDATTSDVSGSTLALNSGAGIGSGGGGGLFLSAGDGGGNGGGGGFSMAGGDSQGIGDGGSGLIRGGHGGPTSGNGGDLIFQAGNARGGDGNGGNYIFNVGEGHGTGQNGTFRFENQAGGAAVFDFSTLSEPQGTTFIFPNTTASFPNSIGTFGLLESDQTWSGLNKFEASSGSTIYIGSSTKSGCIALGDSDGDGITYITANDGVLTASTTKPSICQ